MEGLQTTQEPVLQRGLIRVMSNSQLDAMERANQVPQPTPQETMSRLAGYMRTLWEEAKRLKQPIEEILLRCKRQVEGEYDPQKLAALRSVDSAEVFMMITAQKCRDAKAWILDILQPAGDKPWSIEPTPKPELSPFVVESIRNQVLDMLFKAVQAYGAETGRPVGREEFNVVAQKYMEELKLQVEKQIMEKAEKSAAAMSSKIEDQLIQGSWHSAFSEAIDDLVSYPVGIMKGPVVRRRKTISWIEDHISGDHTPDVKNSIVVDFERVSPFDIYPLGKSMAGDLFERHQLTRKDLNELIGVPGYKDEDIRAVLNDYGRGGLKEWLWTDIERASLEQKNTQALYTSKTIDALQFWGSVQGSLLLEWGLSPAEVPDPDLDYDIEAWLIGTHVIKAVLNPDKLGKKPYYKASFEEKPGSFWGKGIPQLIEDIQEICNATARAIVNNMGIASGPQVEVDVDRLAPGESAENFWPWKIWRTSSKNGMKDGRAIHFYQPGLLTESLIKVYEKFKREADDLTVPAFAHGDTEVGGAGNTAAGLSMLISSSSRGIKQVIKNVDTGMIAPQMTGLYNFNMLYDKDKSIKGDAQVKARGSSSLIAKEQLAIRRKELLLSTNNPTDMRIMGMEGRRELLKEAVKAAEMPVDKVIPENAGIPIAQGGQPETEGANRETKAPQKETELNHAGDPKGGQDTALFNGKR